MCRRVRAPTLPRDMSTTSDARPGTGRPGRRRLRIADAHRGHRQRLGVHPGADQAPGPARLGVPRPGGPGARRAARRDAAQRRRDRPHDPRAAGLGLPGAPLLRAAGPRRRRLHRPLDRRPARARAAPRRRRLGHQAVPSRGAHRPPRGGRTPPPAQRAARRSRAPSRPASSRSAPTSSRPSSTAARSTSRAASSSSSSCWPAPRAASSSARRSTSASGATRWPAATARSTCSCASCARSSRRPRRTGATSTRTSASATASRPSRSRARSRSRTRRRSRRRAVAGLGLADERRSRGARRAQRSYAARVSTARNVAIVLAIAALIAFLPGGGDFADDRLADALAGLHRRDRASGSPGPTGATGSTSRRLPIGHRVLLYGAIGTLVLAFARLEPDDADDRRRAAVRAAARRLRRARCTRVWRQYRSYA